LPSSKKNTQWATGKYTSVTHRATKTSQVPNRARSAIAPLISAGVMIANISWKAANPNVGTVPVRLSMVTPLNPSAPSPPSRPEPTSEVKARLYPYSTHRTLTTAIVAKLIMSMFKTLFARTIPP
jgi:hypothetical protein